MRTLALKPKATQQTRPTKSTIPIRGHFGQSPEVKSIRYLQRTIGNQALQRMLEANAEDGKRDSTTTDIARFDHDFSKISVVSSDRAASTATSDNDWGIRSNVKHHRHTFSAAIRRLSPALQNDSISGNQRKSATDFEAQATQTPIAPSGRSTREPKEGETVRFPKSVLPAIAIPARWDAIASTLTYEPTINKISPPRVPGMFGQTDTKIEVNRSSATYTNSTFNVELIIDNVISFWVAGGTRQNIASDADPKITQTNYPTIVSDLTPSAAAVNAGGMVLLKNQPPRTQFWAEDLTIKHERFHADENEKFGREGAILSRDWLNRQTARTYDEVQVLLGTVSQMVARRITQAMAPPGVEQRAYDYGAADYLARARAIKTKGDANGYAPRPPAP